MTLSSHILLLIVTNGGDEDDCQQRDKVVVDNEAFIVVVAGVLVLCVFDFVVCPHLLFKDSNGDKEDDSDVNDGDNDTIVAYIVAGDDDNGENDNADNEDNDIVVANANFDYIVFAPCHFNCQLIQ